MTAQPQRSVLSYSLLDSEFALKLATDLKNSGLLLYMDRLDAQPDDAWEVVNRADMSRDAALIAVLSPDASVTPYTRADLEYARNYGLPVFPVLTRPVRGADYPDDLLQRAVDFTRWRSEPAYQQAFERLLTLIHDEARDLFDALPYEETRYLQGLIAHFEAAQGVLEFIDLADQTARATEQRVRPRSRASEFWGALNGVQLRFDERRVRVDRRLPSLRKALSEYGRLVLVGGDGVGKSAALGRLVLDDARARLNDRANPLPIYANLGDWDGKTPISEFVRSQCRIEAEPPFDPIAELTQGLATLYLDGLDEMGSGGKVQAQALREWLRSEDAPPFVIIASRVTTYSDALQLDLPVVELLPLTESGAAKIIASMLDKPHASALTERLFQRANGGISALGRMALRPAYLAMLIFLYKLSPQSDLPNSVGRLIERYISVWWGWKQRQRMPDWIDHSMLGAAMGRLAILSVEAHGRGSVAQSSAEASVGAEALTAAQMANLLRPTNQMLRFADRRLQAYFAAAALARADLPTRLRAPRFDEWGERVANQWDDVFVVRACIDEQPDAFVREIIEVDPYLAGQCLLAGAQVDISTRHQVITSLRLLTGVGSGRVAAAQLLCALGESDCAEALLALMRGDANWQLRQTAARVLREAQIAVPCAALTELRHWTWERNNAYSETFRALGSGIVPVFMDVLRDDPSWEKQRAAAWALAQTADRAAVPALVEGLDASDPLVRRECALSLGQLGDPSAIAPLLHTMYDVDWRVARAASEALVKFGSAALPSLSMAINSEKPEIRVMALRVLPHIDDPSVLSIMLRALADSDLRVQVEAIDGLGALKRDEAISALVDMTRSMERASGDERTIRAHAIDALRAINTKNALAAVELARRSGPSTERLPDRTKREPAETGTSVQRATKTLKRYDDLSSWAQRKRAAEELGSADDPSVVPALVDALLHDPSEDVRHACVLALDVYGGEKAQAALTQALGDPIQLVAYAAANALGHMGEVALPGLLKALRSPNIDTRAAAITGLAIIGSPQAREPLELLLDDDACPTSETRSIKEMAAEALARIPAPEPLPVQEPPPAVEVPVSLANSKPAFTAPPAALAAISDLPTQTVNAVSATPTEPTDEPVEQPLGEPQEDYIFHIERMISAMRGRDLRQKENAARDLIKEVRGLRDVDNPRLTELLVDALADDVWMVRLAAIEALAWLRDPATIPALLEKLNDPKWTLRLAVIRALLEIGDVNVTPALVARLSDKEPAVRVAAADALGSLGTPTGLPGLARSLRDTHEDVRRAAAIAMGKIRSSKSASILAQSLTDEDARVRFAAAEALGRIGNPSAAPHLKALLKDRSAGGLPGELVCDAAAKALQSIDQTPETEAILKKWQTWRGRIKADRR